MQLLHVQIFSDRPCQNIFSQKLTTHFGLTVDQDCIMEHACIFSSRYCVYVLMEHFTSAVVDMEIVDKGETKGVSTDMEREGLRRLLLRHEQGLVISEPVTDATFVIQKLVKDLKGIHPFNLFCNALALPIFVKFYGLDNRTVLIDTIKINCVLYQLNCF